MRAAIHLFLLAKRGLSLIGNPDFLELEKTFKAALTYSLKQPTSVVDGDGGYRAIDVVDLAKLSAYFDRTDPKKLQHETFFLIEKREKNVSARSASTKKEIGIFPVADEAKCPVQAVMLYLSKLPEENLSLFPKPRAKWTDREWYCKKEVISKNTLAELMKEISKAAGLSYMYTNHCICSTMIMNLSEQGFNLEQIQTVSSHKKVESVLCYTKRVSVEQKRSLLSAMTSGLHGLDSGG
uniref:Phage_integrase domain-containing protein n=1 Tax=Macrostomum lignano TaxID=282301 RepID=A0A1I8GNZ1_9PLAT